MSVAETTALSAPPRAPHVTLALHSIVGGAVLLLALWIIFGGLPLFWSEVLQASTVFNEFLSSALLFVVTLLAAVGVIIVLRKLERAYEQPGLRAGVVFGAVFIFMVLAITRWFGNWMESRELGIAGPVLTLGVLAGLTFLTYKFFFRPAWAQRLQRIEENGWFHATSYKGNQGLKVRRGTIIAVLTIGACGIYTLVSHKSLGSARYGPNDWIWTVPFTDYQVPVAPGPDVKANAPASYDLYQRFIPIMYSVDLTVPLLLAAGLFWLAWRLVNWPTFADFLIATEAEMNKVSWTTRRRLMQDTVVVLVTVFLMTLFLFFVDILWIKGLSLVRVLQVDIKAEVKKQQEKSQW